MHRVRRNYTLSENVLEQFEEEVENGDRSHIVEQALIEYLDLEEN